MPRYQIHIPLWRFAGAKTGRVYNCTRAAIYNAPEGEFKQLVAGREYSRLDGGRQTADGSNADGSNADGSPDDPQPDDPQPDDS